MPPVSDVVAKEETMAMQPFFMLPLTRARLFARKHELNSPEHTAPADASLSSTFQQTPPPAWRRLPPAQASAEPPARHIE